MESVKLIVYNLLGEEVQKLVDVQQSPGNYKVQFNASSFSSGIYFYQLTTENGFMMTKKMLFIK